MSISELVIDSSVAMASTKSRLPDCGLYRTTKPLPDHEGEVPAGTLVYSTTTRIRGSRSLLRPSTTCTIGGTFTEAGFLSAACLGPTLSRAFPPKASTC